MVIEFFGAPGAGKSTLLRALVQQLPNAREIQVTSRADVALGVARFFVVHPVSFFVWMYALVTNARGLFRYKLGLLLRAMALCARAEATPAPHIALVDEGLLQRILTVFEKPLAPKHAATLLNRMPLSDIVVVVQGGDFDRFTTAPNRFASPRVRLGEKDLERWMQVVVANAELVAGILPRFTKVIKRKREDPSHLDALVQEIERVRKE